MEVEDIIKPAVTISEEASFREALSAMINGQTNTLLVVNDIGILVGEVSVADLLDAIIPTDLDGDSIAATFKNEGAFEQAVKEAEDQTVKFFMSSDFNVVEATDDLMTIATTAIAGQRARIPVVDSENRPIGIISRQGLKHIIADFLGIKDPTAKKERRG